MCRDKPTKVTDHGRHGPSDYASHSDRGQQGGLCNVLGDKTRVHETVQACFFKIISLFMTATSVQVGRKSPWTCENKQLWYLQQRGGRRLVSASLHLPGSERINPGELPRSDTRVLISGKIYELYSSGEAFLRTAHSHYSHKEGKFDVGTHFNIRLPQNTTEVSIYLFIHRSTGGNKTWNG